MVAVPRQRAAVNTGRYGGRHRGESLSPPPEPGLLARAAREYVSGAAFCAGFLTVAALTALLGMWLT